MNVHDLNYRLNRFVDTFSKIVMGGIVLTLAGIAMKMMALPSGGLVFVLAVSLLALLFLVQIGLSFIYITSELRLALLGAFCSLGLVLGFLAIIFRYQVWLGWQVILFISLPLYLVSAVLLVVYLMHRKELHTTHRKFLLRNLVVPFTFTMVLLLVSFLLRPGTFYETFKAREAKKELHDGRLDLPKSSD